MEAIREVAHIVFLSVIILVFLAVCMKDRNGKSDDSSQDN